jgi:hypothetical protein
MDAAGTGTTAGATGPAESVDMSAIFDGWGYVHLFKASNMSGLDQYAIPESQNESFAEGYGDLSVHEVATDPARQLAYLSYYAGGFRVLSYKGGQLVEKGKFIEQGGSNFWGVEIYRRGTQQYVLGSDRDTGLYIFRYTGKG